MKLEQIGFYTLSAKTTSPKSPIMRAELLLTDRCNLKCPYCRGLKSELKGDISLPYAQYILQQWVDNGLTNVRFSGGEPTLYPYLKQLIKGCKRCGVRRIALSTNGTASLDFYRELIDCGVNDFSISLDSGCCSIGKVMCGGSTIAWKKASTAIKELSKLTYVTVGAVFNELNVNYAVDTIKWIDGLNPLDIRIISSAQYDKALDKLSTLSDSLVNRYPILKYRLTNFKQKRNVRGLRKGDCNKCYLVLDDIAVAGGQHFPCIIYLREQGQAIGKMNGDFRNERVEWFKKHNTFEDKICLKNCLDVCIDYNNRVNYYVKKNRRKLF